MERTDNQSQWDAMRLVREYVRKADFINHYEGKPFDDIAWSNQIRIKRIASVLRAFLGMKGVADKPLEQITSVFGGRYYDSLFELSPLQEKDKDMLHAMVKQAMNDDEKFEYLISRFNASFRDRAQMLHFFLEFRVEAENLLSHFESAMEARLGGILAYHAIRGMYFPFLRSSNEKVDEMIVLLLGDNFKQSFSEEELKADYGYPMETDRELDDWDCDNY